MEKRNNISGPPTVLRGGRSCCPLGNFRKHEGPYSLDAILVVHIYCTKILKQTDYIFFSLFYRGTFKGILELCKRGRADEYYLSQILTGKGL